MASSEKDKDNKVKTINSDVPTESPNHVTAHEMAEHQRNISVSEFFLKNRHLLGFDSLSKALVTSVKEAVDNALDACEEAAILPEIRVEISRIDDNIYLVAVEDNGPGIVESQISRIFGKLLYGSKFHKLSQSRGQQGIGISATGMYGQLTTGKPMHIFSRVEGEEQASELRVSIDTTRNRPNIHKKKKIDWDRPHGTRIEVEIEGYYQKGFHSVDLYLKQTAIVNPHVTLHFKDPHGREITYERSSADLPPYPAEIKPHPYGIELGMLIQMLRNSKSKTLMKFLTDEFSRVGIKTAQKIIKQAGGRMNERSNPRHIAHAQAASLYKGVKKTPISSPRTDCIVPIGRERLLKGLQKELDADFYTVISRPPAVYRGNPFQVEVGIAFGRSKGAGLDIEEHGHIRKLKQGTHDAAEEIVARADEPVHLLRFANWIPLLYQQAGCAITKAVIQTNWRNYGLRQTKGGLPVAPMAILVHIASVWVPYTSESKEAIAPYPEILRELKLAMQACGRQLSTYIHHEKKLRQEYDKRAQIDKYLPHVGIALQEILHLSDNERKQIVENLDKIMVRTRRFR